MNEKYARQRLGDLVRALKQQGWSDWSKRPTKAGTARIVVLDLRTGDVTPAVYHATFGDPYSAARLVVAALNNDYCSQPIDSYLWREVGFDIGHTPSNVRRPREEIQSREIPYVVEDSSEAQSDADFIEWLTTMCENEREQGSKVGFSGAHVLRLYELAGRPRPPFVYSTGVYNVIGLDVLLDDVNIEQHLGVLGGDDEEQDKLARRVQNWRLE